MLAEREERRVREAEALWGRGFFWTGSETQRKGGHADAARKDIPATNEAAFREGRAQGLPIEADIALVEKFGFFPVVEEVGTLEEIIGAACDTGASGPGTDYALVGEDMRPMVRKEGSDGVA